MTSINKSKIEEELKKLAMDYIDATNKKRVAEATAILANMEELKKLTNA